MPVVPGEPLGAILLEPIDAPAHLLFGQPTLDPAAAREAAARPRPTPAVRRALVDVAEGLDALHRAGLCHGDLRPDNALVGPDGRARLIDFGPWAPGEAEGARRERPPAYLAPEQAPDAPPDPPADCYAFGVLLFEALTGHLPFAGSALDVTMRKTTLPPPRPSFLARNVEAALDELARALLARDPADRPSAAEALARLRPGG
jgi:serine/threonine protein kinase